MGKKNPWGWWNDVREPTPHSLAAGKYLEAHGPRARQRRAEQCRAERVLRTPQDQLDRLDERLGHGVGAKRERNRLSAQIEAVAAAEKGDTAKVRQAAANERWAIEKEQRAIQNQSLYIGR